MECISWNCYDAAFRMLEAPARLQDGCARLVRVRSSSVAFLQVMHRRLLVSWRRYFLSKYFYLELSLDDSPAERRDSRRPRHKRCRGRRSLREGFCLPPSLCTHGGCIAREQGLQHSRACFASLRQQQMVRRALIGTATAQNGMRWIYCGLGSSYAHISLPLQVQLPVTLVCRTLTADPNTVGPVTLPPSLTPLLLHQPA